MKAVMPAAYRVLAIALVAMSVLYAAWFWRMPPAWAELAVFAMPPALLALSLARGNDRARTAFWAGVLALAWFSHGVMVAWTRPDERGPALAAAVLAVIVVFAASLPGLKARREKRRR